MTAAARAEQSPASATFAQACVSERRTSADDAVGTLSDSEREEAIKRAGDLMERRYADFARTGDLADLGDAHRAMLSMKALVAGRSGA